MMEGGGDGEPIFSLAVSIGRIADPGSGSASLLGTMIWVVHHGTGAGIRTFIPSLIPDPEVKKNRIPDPDLQHCVLVRIWY